MKALVYEKYGPPKIQKLVETPKPIPKGNEVLVKVYATSLNSADFDQLRGTVLGRLYGPLRPRYKILGSDIAGVVEAVGKDVVSFKPGEEVMADLTEVGFGAFAEYRCVSAEDLTRKPMEITFEEAAAIPSAGVIALQGIRSLREITPGQHVLVNGAGGGMGTFAVQMAKSAGAIVTGLDTTVKIDKIRQLGADRVIDYTKDNYTKEDHKYDLILDCHAEYSMLTYKRLLEPDGIYFMIGGTLRSILQAATLGPLLSKSDGKRLGILMGRPNRKEDMEELLRFYQSGRIKPTIDRVFPMESIVDAMKYFEEGTFVGKIVISMRD